MKSISVVLSVILLIFGVLGSPHIAGASLLTGPINGLPEVANFGYVPVGSTKDLSLTVKNAGGGTLTGNATTSAPFSIVSGDSYTLDLGQNQVVTVRYQPTSQGPHTGTVVFTGTDRATVQVTGKTEKPIGLPWLSLLLGDSEKPLVPIDQAYTASIIQSSFIPDSNIIFVGVNTSNQEIKALRPLVDEIFATYGYPSTSIGKARAIRDFVARYAIHPFLVFHYDTTIANISVLPEGKTWTDFNGIFSNFDGIRWYSDAGYWFDIWWPDGFNMLNALFGTINLDTLQRADDGMLSKIDTGRYRIKDFDSYRAVLCTYQQHIFIPLLASAGLHGMRLRTDGHDPAAVFIPEFGKWIYEDPTYNEEYTLDGNGIPLSPFELLYLSVADDFHRLIPLKNVKPNWDSNIYSNPLEHPWASYTARMNKGFLVMGSQLRNDFNDNPAWVERNVQVAIDGLYESPYGNEEAYLRVDPSTAFPDLGVGVEWLIEGENGFNVSLKSSFPNHVKFIKKINNGLWQDCNDIDFLPLDEAVVTYRSIDSENFYGMDAIINIVKKATRTY